MLKNNYHTHTKYCNHAEGEVEDYVKKAISLGMKELGMSDHNPMHLEYLNGIGLDDPFLHKFCEPTLFKNGYLKEVDKCKEKYKDQIKIYKGAECEFYKDDIEYYRNLRSQLDYMILGVHFYLYNGQFINSFRETNYDNVEGYFQTAIDAMNSGLYKYFAHPDLVFARYISKDGTHKYDEKIKNGFIRMIECAIKNDVILEINAGGIRNSFDWGHVNDYAYPTKEFFNIAKTYKDVKIIIGADCHSPYLLDCMWTDKAEEFAKELNIPLIDKIDFND